MNDFAFTTDQILMLLPLLALQLGLFIYCAVKIFKEGVQNLNKWVWLVICLLLNFIGPIAFMIVGRRRENYD